MVVGVDQPGSTHAREHRTPLRRAARVLSQGQHFDDHTVLQHQAATGIEAIGSENGEGF
jgi:hypothetical protein